MDQRRAIRAADRDRQEAADRLRAAVEDGRLDLYEYDSRLARAYSAVTYADLEALFHDLPTGSARAAREPATRSLARAGRPGRRSGLPTAVKILWIVWASAVAINLTIWTLIQSSSDGPVYFWPMWLVIPGVALTAVSVGLVTMRRGGAPSH